MNRKKAATLDEHVGPKGAAPKNGPVDIPPTGLRINGGGDRVFRHPNASRNVEGRLRP